MVSTQSIKFNSIVVHLDMLDMPHPHIIKTLKLLKLSLYHHLQTYLSFKIVSGITVRTPVIIIAVKKTRSFLLSVPEILECKEIG